MAKAYVSPNGDPITGTMEMLFGRAHLTKIEDDGSPIYSGGTEIFWDGQTTAITKEGKLIFLDDEGNEWTFDQLLPAPEEEDETRLCDRCDEHHPKDVLEDGLCPACCGEDE